MNQKNSGKGGKVPAETESLPPDTSNGSRFLDLARKLVAVPKPEYNREAEAVKNGKPLRPLPKPAP